MADLAKKLEGAMQGRGPASNDWLGLGIRNLHGLRALWTAVNEQPMAQGVGETA